MLRQHSQYDSRLGFSFRVLVRLRVRVRLVLGFGLGLELGFWVRVRVRVRVDFRVRVGVGVRIRVNLTLTLTLTVTKTLKVNPNLLSYWECCRNMVRKKHCVRDGGSGGQLPPNSGSLLTLIRAESRDYPGKTQYMCS